MRSIRGKGEVSRKTAARSDVLKTLRHEPRDPQHIFSGGRPGASDLCCEANAVTRARA